jgi:hypothetical protein
MTAAAQAAIRRVPRGTNGRRTSAAEACQAGARAHRCHLRSRNGKGYESRRHGLARLQHDQFRLPSRQQRDRARALEQAGGIYGRALRREQKEVSS